MVVNASLSMNQCHLYAQKLNNSAALCIEIGHYDRAIISLTKALRLSREQSDESILCSCRCKDCSLDGCIAYSESSPPVSKISQQAIDSIKNHCCEGCHACIYRRPIRVPPQPILDKHNMGRTLFLMITFNLGLAHHLSAMVTPRTNPSTSRDEQKSASQLSRQRTQTNTMAKMITKALQLYELSNNWHSRISESRPHVGHECDANGGLSSIRFRMILSNNLSHAHCLSKNHTKQRRFLENLLSTVMVAVEYQTRNDNNSSTNDNSNNWRDDSESSSHDENLSTGNVEGFLMNASVLFLNRFCADAA